MAVETKKCEMCAEEIPVEASVCEYCGAEYNVVVKGYCSTDHKVVEADENGLCPTCGGELVDRQVKSKWIEEADVPEAVSPPSDVAPPSIEGIGPLEQKNLVDSSNVGCK